MNLSGVDLLKRDLSRRNLIGANFSCCNLSSSSVLTGANLTGARLKGKLSYFVVICLFFAGAKLPTELHQFNMSGIDLSKCTQDPSRVHTSESR